MQTTKDYALYAGNPELTRNIWQELTLQRLIVVPVVLLLLLILTKYSASDAYFHSRLMRGSLMVFALVAFFWGTRLVGDTLAQEFTDGTWDSQRMSGLKAMPLVIGKLFGGTIIVWYALVFLLGAFVYACMSKPYGAVSGWVVFQAVLGLILLTIIMHGLTMSSLLALWKKQDSRASKNMRFAMALPLLGACVLSFTSISIASNVYRNWAESDVINWFSMGFNVLTLMLLIVFFMACWVIIGVWQQMRSELRFYTQPWWWLGFLVFWMFILAGFVTDEWNQPQLGGHWLIYLRICLAFVILSVYVQMLFATKDSMYWLRFSGALKRKNFKAFGNLFPAWLTSYIVALVLSCVLVGMMLYRNEQHMIWFVISVAFFVFRDILLAIWLNLSKDNKRADAAWVFYLVILYGLLPWLAHEAVSEYTQYLFHPVLAGNLFWDSSYAWVTLSPVIQAIVMLVLVIRRWNKRKIGAVYVK